MAQFHSQISWRLLSSKQMLLNQISLVRVLVVTQQTHLIQISWSTLGRATSAQFQISLVMRW
jgi:hypothetical protein